MNKLYIRIVSAEGLHGADLGGKSDPFCRLSINGKEIPDKIKKKGKIFDGETKIIKKTVSPVWNETFVLYVTPGNENSDHLLIQIFDHDKLSKNDSLGGVKIPLSDLLSGQPVSGAYKVVPLKKEKAKGKIHLKLHYCPIGVPFQTKEF
ncbi:c2 domain-containing protein [Anaeramoeba flamelloides]|uniref:C2 domain-containing protein n=1 Tax=Anaeramoeba flamelloides TaxID=1746091 RepID=A0AAV7YCE6_9EUKA|nr:c2 domain-containing protein [Anaeramoeba flamelloides]KAJ6228274.1 c2 domain-containing protein [Anaeramoeba flamelloides]|eukprot:Anaeramoba_flamelloidesc34770_g1_i1.p1 GENE.c34770_g1_i1~~c34770_g1_i1.p1  ORF type:complete len:149 (-),score=36.46 c34770_g1_i1:197-643(-)